MIHKKWNLVVATAIACAVWALPQLILASEDSSGALEEIVVTAQRRSEKQVDVPISVTNLADSALRNNGITIWLDCPFETVKRRVAKAADRPLARDPAAFAALYQARREFYSMADIRVAIECDDPEEVVLTTEGRPLCPADEIRVTDERRPRGTPPACARR